MDKLISSSNLQGLENDKPIPQGEPNETIYFNSDRQISTSEHQSTGEIIKEKSDIYRLQDEDFRLRVDEIASTEHHKTDDSRNNRQHPNGIQEYDPIVHPDSKFGRLQLSIRYENERSQLIIQIIDAEGIIRPEQIYAPEMCLTFSLVGNDNVKYKTEKHERIIVDNAPVHWKEPVIFCITYEKVIVQNLYILIANRSDPSTPCDREVLIPLNNFKLHAEEIKKWFNLQFVKST